MNLTALYEKLERLVTALPGPLQSPILREIAPLRMLFLHRRPPRIALLGAREASRSALVNGLFGEDVAKPGEDAVQIAGWQLFSDARGKLRLLDARRPASMVGVTRGLAAEKPDLFLFLESASGGDPEAAAESDHALQIIQLTQGKDAGSDRVMLGVVAPDSPQTERGARAATPGAAGRPPPSAMAEKVAGWFALDGTSEERIRLTKAIAAELPAEAKLEMARLSGLKEIQLEAAGVLIKSASAICGAIGAQPIPLADFPILTALQGAMVAGIMHISGRELSTRLAGEWIAALGANVGMALVLREGARAALKFVPVWGDMVSGGIAAAGTYAIGRAASAYFIEGVTLDDARRALRKEKRKPPLLKNPS